MTEAQNYIFDYREIVEVLIKKQGVREGLWGIYMEFDIGGANIGETEHTIFPTAIVPVVRIGIQRFEKPNNLTVDAAKANPKVSESPARRKGRQAAKED